MIYAPLSKASGKEYFYQRHIILPGQNMCMNPIYLDDDNNHVVALKVKGKESRTREEDEEICEHRSGKQITRDFELTDSGIAYMCMDGGASMLIDASVYKLEPGKRQIVL